MKLVARLLIVYAAPFVLFACPLPASAGATGEIAGTVTDAASGAPIPNASIAASSPSGSYKANTDARGYYAIVGVYPDTYAITASASGYDAHTAPGNTVNQEQSFAVNFVLARTIRTLATIRVTSGTGIVQPSTTADVYVLNTQQASLANGSGGSSALYQIQSVANTLPGVSPDPFGLPHIRGGRGDEFGLEYDGINTSLLLTNFPGTNFVDDGLSRVEVSTGAVDPSGGNAISGTMNVIVGRGTYPPRGDATILVQSPTYYHGINFEYGSATPDQRFSYFFSGVWWNSDYDYAVRPSDYAGMFDLGAAFGDASPSRDQVLNLVYRMGDDDRNELQLLGTTGYVHWDLKLHALYYPSDNPGDGPLPISNTAVNGICDNGIALFPGQSGCLQTIGNATDHQDRSYYIEKLQFTHRFSASSFAAVRLSRLGAYTTGSFPFGDEPHGDFWVARNGDQQEADLELADQLGSRHLLRLGLGAVSSVNAWINGTASVLPLAANDIVAPVTLTNEYLQDRFQPSDKVTIAFGLRAEQQRFKTLYQPAFTENAVEPRLAAVFDVDRLTVIRSSYGRYVLFPNIAQVEQIFVNWPNFKDTSPSNWIFPPQETQPAPTVSRAADFSLERNLGRGWQLKITPFWRDTDNLVVDFSGHGALAQIPQNVGSYFVNGLEAGLQAGHSGDGWSGYVSYTHVRALSQVPSDFEQPLTQGTLLIHQLLRSDFVPANTASLVMQYRRGRFEINPEINYSSGYPYGVGRTIACYGPEPTGNGVCDNAPPGTITFQPNPDFYDKRGDPIDTTEGGEPNSLTSPAQTLVNLNVYYSLSDRVKVGIQVQNLLREYTPITFLKNPYFTYAGDLGNGINPYGFDFGQDPYTPVAYQGVREFLGSITFRF